MPYVYTQCEDINCRSVVPVMDTPSNKQTYSARVLNSNVYSAHMSANVTHDAPLPSDTTMQEKHFQCDIKIPSYLLAIAVGDIE